MSSPERQPGSVVDVGFPFAIAAAAAQNDGLPNSCRILFRMNRKPTTTTMAEKAVNTGVRKYSTLDEIRVIQPVEFDALGQHLIIDFHDCQSIPTSAKSIEQIMLATAREIEATVVTSSFHEFSPHGLSGVVVIAESHLAAHTWPEHNVVCVDLFTCSSDMVATAGLVFLFESLDAGSMTLASVSRGNINHGNHSEGQG